MNTEVDTSTDIPQFTLAEQLEIAIDAGEILYRQRMEIENEQKRQLKVLQQKEWDEFIANRLTPFVPPWLLTHLVRRDSFPDPGMGRIEIRIPDFAPIHFLIRKKVFMVQEAEGLRYSGEWYVPTVDHEECTYADEAVYLAQQMGHEYQALRAEAVRRNEARVTPVPRHGWPALTPSEAVRRNEACVTPDTQREQNEMSEMESRLAELDPAAQLLNHVSGMTGRTAEGGLLWGMLMLGVELRAIRNELRDLRLQGE